MVSSTAQSLLSLMGWAIVPDFVTVQALRIFHVIYSTQLRKPPPQRGTPQYRNHYAYTFAIVVLSYLTYSLVEGVRHMPPNFYQILGVTQTVDEASLKAAFRQFAKRYHPDRPDVGRAGEELFMVVRDAFEALKNPVVRFAYDRFGPVVLSWEDCTTPAEYIRRGLLQATAYHIVVGAALLFWSAIGKPSPVSFWRYTLYASLFIAELALILSPSPYPLNSFSPSLPTAPLSASPTSIPSSLQSTISPFTLFHTLLPSQVTYQHIQFLHQFFLFLSVALSRVAPQLFPQEDPRVELILLDRINALSALADREASVLLHTLYHSISPQNTEDDQKPSPTDTSRVTLSRMQPLQNPSPSLLASLFKDMENLIIEANIQKDEIGPLRAAWEAALMRAKGGQVGARSTLGVESQKEDEKDHWEPQDTEPDKQAVQSSSDGSLTIQKDQSNEDDGFQTIDKSTLPSPRPTPTPPPSHRMDNVADFTTD
ncbi:hypothetical protein AX17_002575 [Amanita inopinata Kibby_2008]|nr:hypothetical protein AX17_002575 [Amanita inopinata Kibby_2008]